MLNKLAYHIAYLSGPMDRIEWSTAVEWREEMTKFLFSRKIGVLDPCNKPSQGYNEGEDFREKRKEIKEAGLYGGVREMMKPICGFDLRMVDKADFIIVNIDIEQHLAGTYHELSAALTQKKPTILHCKQGKNNIPDWWFGVVPHKYMFSTWKEVEDCIADIDENGTDNKRWRLFDYDKVYGFSKAIQEG